MLLRREGDRVLAIGQASHAWLSGQLARTWGNARFPPPDPYEEVCLAAEQHDVGWAVWDLDPKRDPESGLPYSFMELPLDEHLALWREAGERLLTQSSYAALLVSMHGSRLYRRRRNVDEVAAVREYLDEQERFQARLRADFDSELLARNSQLIWTWDFLSLAICLGWERSAQDVPTVDGPTDIEVTGSGLRPWPFEPDALTVRCEARRLDGRYETDEALRAALSSASWETLEFELLSTSE